MASTSRVTVTLPAKIVEQIDRLGGNRSRFIVEAVQRELARRSRQGLLLSLEKPHRESAGLAEEGLEEWRARMPPGDEDLLDMSVGKPVRWVEGKGWIEEPP